MWIFLTGFATWIATHAEYASILAVLLFGIVVHIFCKLDSLLFLGYCHLAAKGQGAGSWLIYPYVLLRYAISLRCLLAAALILILYLANAYRATLPNLPHFFQFVLTQDRINWAIKGIAALFFLSDALLLQFAKEELRLFQAMASDVRIIPDGQQRDRLRTYLQANAHVFKAFKYPKEKTKEFLATFCEARARQLH